MALTKVSTHVIADDLALPGNPTTTTQSTGNDTTRIATTAFVQTELSSLVDSAPSTLNTLNELAAALGDDANFSTTVTNSIAAKLPLAGGTMSGALNMGSANITNIGRLSTADGISDTGSAGSSTVFNESGSTADFRIESDSNTHMFFVDGGLNRVGIGTDSPSSPLHVAGTSGYLQRLVGTNAASDVRILLDAGGTSGQIQYAGASHASHADTLTLVSAADIRTVHAGSQRVTIKSDGKVGIGTSSPGRDMVLVSEGSTNGFRIESNDNNLHFLGAGGSSGSAADDGYYGQYSGGTLKTQIWANGTTFFNGGNFGIGDSSPIAKLTVKAAADTIRAESLATDAKHITMSYEDSNDYGAIRSGHDGVVDKNLLLRGHTLLFQRNGGVEAARIDSAGLVGIGTTSPGHKLDVQHTISSGGGDAIANFGTSGSGSWANSGHQVIIGGPSVLDYTGLIIHSDSTSGHGQISFADGRGANDSWRGAIAYAHASDYMHFWTNAGERMRIASNGNVGIGTTDAGNAKLVLNGNISAGADTAMIDFDGFGTYGNNSSQSINFRMGRPGQATDQAAQIRSIFQGGGATGGQTSVGFEFRCISNNTLDTTVRFSGTGQRIQFNTDEVPQSYNPITNQAIVIGPSSSGPVTQGLTNATVLQNRSGELYAVDSSHNNTQLTPHNWGLISSGPSEELAWTYYSQRPNPSNPEQMQTINVDMAKVIRKVEDLVGEKLIYTENSEKDGHTFETIISDIQTTLADLKSRIETLEG